MVGQRFKTRLLNPVMVEKTLDSEAEMYPTKAKEKRTTDTRTVRNTF